jgi:hypothetical protein
MIVREVELLSEEEAKDYLRMLIQKLEDMELNDAFNGRSWQDYLEVDY